MREHCRFLTVKNLPPIEECVVELCGVLVFVYCDVMYCTLVQCVSDIKGARMNTYTYHYRMDGPH